MMGPNISPTFVGATALDGEQPDDDADGHRHHELVEFRPEQFHALGRAQHRDGRRDQRIAEEQRRAHHADGHRTPRPLARLPGLLLDQRDQRQDAALAGIVGAQQQHHVFQ
jgi:hypothetical protein